MSVHESNRATQFARIWQSAVHATPQLIAEDARQAVTSALDGMDAEADRSQTNPFQGQGRYTRQVRDGLECVRAEGVEEGDFARAAQLVFDFDEFGHDFPSVRTLSRSRREEVLPLVGAAVAEALEAEGFRVLAHGVSYEEVFVVMTCPPLDRLDQLDEHRARDEAATFRTTGEGTVIG
jgi:hypothetical protein